MKRKISSVFLLSLLAGTLLTSCISRVNHQSSWQNEPSSSSEPIPSSTNPSSSEPSSWTNPPTSSEPYSTHEEPPSSEPEPYVIGIDLNVDYVRKSYLYDQQNPDFVEEFDGSPLQLRVHHSDGSSLTLGWNQVGHSDPDLTMIGSQEVWVAYEGYRTSFWIDVGTYTLQEAVLYQVGANCVVLSAEGTYEGISTEDFLSYDWQIDFQESLDQSNATGAVKLDGPVSLNAQDGRFSFTYDVTDLGEFLYLGHFGFLQRWNGESYENMNLQITSAQERSQCVVLNGRVYRMDYNLGGNLSLKIFEDTCDPLLSLTLNANEMTMKPFESETLTPTLIDVVGGENHHTGVRWLSTNPDVASVDEHGAVTAHQEGTCQICCLSEGVDSSGARLQAICEVTVTGWMIGELNRNLVGADVVIRARIIYNEGRNLFVVDSTGGVLVYDRESLCIGLEIGTVVKIKGSLALYHDGFEIIPSDVEVLSDVIIEEAPANAIDDKIILSTYQSFMNSSSRLSPIGKVSFRTGFVSGAEPYLTWQTAGVWMETNCLTSGMQAGNVYDVEGYFNNVYSGQHNFLTFVVTNARIVYGLMEITGPSQVEIGSSVQLNARLSGVDSMAFQWSSSDEGVAVVDPDGLVHGIALGRVTITAVHPNDETVNATFSIQIIEPSPYQRLEVAVTSDRFLLSEDGLTGSFTEGDVTVTWRKGTSTTAFRNVDVDHTRIYKNALLSFSVASGSIHHIDVTCMSLSYANVLAGNEIINATASSPSEGNVVTLTATDENVNTIDIGPATAQWRLSSIMVYYLPGA